MSRDLPLLLDDPQVRAVIAGRMTVTRRIDPVWAQVRAGDVLWVRECHAIATGHLYDGLAVVRYRADGQIVARSASAADRLPRMLSMGRWRPSTQMPRWACRLYLEVVSVEQERGLLGGGLGQMAVVAPRVTDEEARMQGLAGRSDFVAAWLRRYPRHVGPVWRVEFRILGGVFMAEVRS